MKATTLTLALLLLGATVTLAVPAASAFDWCVEGTHKDCQSHVVCVGRSWSAWDGESCQVGIAFACPYDCHYLP